MRSAREVSLLAVTVEDLLHLALPAGTTLLGGRAGLGQDVTWAAALRTFPSPFPGLKGGEIALLSLESLRQLEPPSSLEDIVPRLAARGVSAVAVDGAASPAAVAAADAADVPLLGLPGEASLHDLEGGIIRFLSERRAELYRQDAEIQQRLTELALRGRGLEAIVQTLADRSGKIVSLQDDAQRLKYLTLPTQGAGDSQAPADLAAVLESSPPISADGLSPWGIGRRSLSLAGREVAQLGVRLGVGGDRLGYLSLLGVDEVWDRLDILMLGRAASSCALELAKERAVVEAESRLRGDFLAELLEGRIQNEGAALERGRRLGYDLTQPHTIVLWCPDEPPSSQASTPAPDDRRLSALARSAVGRAQGPAPGEAFLLHVSGLKVAGLCATEATAVGPAAEKLVEQVRRRLSEEWGGGHFSASLGRPTTKLSALRTAYREAEQAVSVAQRLFGGDRTACFADLGFYRLLLPLHGSEDLRAFCTEVLGPLEAYDRDNRAEFVRTLEAYFRCHARQQATAQELCLHRNTLAYRLRRIQQLTSCDLDNLEDRFQLQLALKLRGVI